MALCRSPIAFFILAPALLAFGPRVAPQQQALTDTPTSTPVPSDTPTNTPFSTDTPTSTPSPTPILTDTPTPTPTDTPTPTATNTPGPPMVSVSSITGCRTGPGSNYAGVYTLFPGVTAMVVGMDIADGYWVISVPGAPGTLCWLPGQHAVVSGDISHLPSPATPQPPILYTLSEPKNFSAGCSAVPYADDGDDEDNDPDDASAWTVILHWTNTEPNATGVRIFRWGRRIATLTPGTRSYTDYFIHYDNYYGVRYGVQAFNGNQVSSIVWTSMNSCR